MAITKACKEVISFRGLLGEIYDDSHIITVFCDS